MLRGGFVPNHMHVHHKVSSLINNIRDPNLEILWYIPYLCIYNSWILIVLVFYLFVLKVLCFLVLFREITTTTQSNDINVSEGFSGPITWPKLSEKMAFWEAYCECLQPNQTLLVILLSNFEKNIVNYMGLFR